MIERAEVAVGAIVRRADELLLVRRGHEPAAGEWSVPGGPAYRPFQTGGRFSMKARGPSRKSSVLRSPI